MKILFLVSLLITSSQAFAIPLNSTCTNLIKNFRGQYRVTVEVVHSAPSELLVNIEFLPPGSLKLKITGSGDLVYKLANKKFQNKPSCALIPLLSEGQDGTKNATLILAESTNSGFTFIGPSGGGMLTFKSLSN